MHILEGTKGTFGKATAQKIGMRYVSTRFNMTIQALPGANDPLPNGPLVASEPYTRSPLEDSRLFGPSPWKILATTYEQMGS